MLLREKFKGDADKTFHFVVVTAKSSSGLKIWYRMDRGIVSRDKQGVTQRYLFTNSKGGMIRSRHLEVDMLDRIARIQQEHFNLIRSGLDVNV